MSKKVFSFILSSTFLVGAFDEFHKHFTAVTYNHSKISWTINCMHASMQCFQNALAYLDTSVSYTLKCILNRHMHYKTYYAGKYYCSFVRCKAGAYPSGALSGLHPRNVSANLRLGYE
jgi:hypothetical protein